MIATTVTAIATAMTVRRAATLVRTSCMGDAGYSSSAAKQHTRTIRTPSSAPSIRYYGQWLVRDPSIFTLSLALRDLHTPRLPGRLLNRNAARLPDDLPAHPVSFPPEAKIEPIIPDLHSPEGHVRQPRGEL